MEGLVLHSGLVEAVSTDRLFTITIQIDAEDIHVQRSCRHLHSLMGKSEV